MERGKPAEHSLQDPGSELELSWTPPQLNTTVQPWITLNEAELPSQALPESETDGIIGINKIIVVSYGSL